MADQAPQAAKPVSAPAKLHKYRILRSFWDDEGKRVDDNSILEMTADEAMDKVESGIIERVKVEKA